MTTDSAAEPAAAPRTLDDVPGWFHPADRALFSWILERQSTREPAGDLVELGAYMGKSAIVIGRGLQEGERFTVCDLFGMPAPDETNRWAAKFYTDHLTRDAFESNYLAFHAEPPTVIHGPTSVILDHVDPGTCRFVHVDASHLYDLVREDITAARTMLRDGGVVVMDDYRTEHAPGTAAAVWGAVLNDGLKPICLTGMKFYATWGDPTPVQDELLEWVKTQPEFKTSYQQVAGHRIVRVFPAKPTKPAKPANAAAKPKAKPAAPKPKAPAPERPLLRRLALDATPPALARAIRRARKDGDQPDR